MITVKPCWKTHPTYNIGGKYPVRGGSCVTHYPSVDIFVGLDFNSLTGGRYYHWNDGKDILFPIEDMGVPKDVNEFKILLQYLSTQLKQGKSLFIGCIGGHGRTGLVLAALTTYMTGDIDSITTVRKLYCNKAVESQTQVAWLKKHFGIKPIKESKGGYMLTGATPTIIGNVTDIRTHLKFYHVDADTLWDKILDEHKQKGHTTPLNTNNI
jgi:hypothetical protein